MLISVIAIHLLHRDGTSFLEMWIAVVFLSAFAQQEFMSKLNGISVSNQPKTCCSITSVYSTNYFTDGTAAGYRYKPAQYKIIVHAIRQWHKSNLSISESKRVALISCRHVPPLLTKIIKLALWSSLVNHHIHVNNGVQLLISGLTSTLVWFIHCSPYKTGCN